MAYKEHFYEFKNIGFFLAITLLNILSNKLIIENYANKLD